MSGRPSGSAEGIVVGSVDTGAQLNHPALVGKYRGNLGAGTFTTGSTTSNVCGNPSNVPCDNNNHGTHTIGTMVGDDGGSNQIGVAPGARWIAAKGCESNSCSDSGLLESAEFMLAPTDLSGQNPRPDLRPNIVNNSWGGGGGDSWFQAAVGAWRRRDSSQRLWQVQPWRNSRTRSRATPATRLPSFEPG